jgi:TIR domain
MPIQQTTEFAATSPEVTRAVVQNLRTSDRRYRVFEAVYSGGNRPKDASALAVKTGLTEVAVLQLATPMANRQFFEQVKHQGRVAFKKYPHINAVKQTILGAAKKKVPVQTKGARTVQGEQDSGATQRRPRGSSTRSAWTSTTRKRKSKTAYDAFVCHASEDKSFVARLVKALKAHGVKVWYDEDLLLWGDGLRGSIDRGLTNSRYGIVVFSKAFLKKKHWTEHELNGLFAKERKGRKVILPIWHKITDRELLQYSPAFADRIAMISKRDSIADIVNSLKKLLSNS